MKTIAKHFRLQAARITAVVVMLAIYGFARLPELSEPERAQLASHFNFERMTLPEIGGKPFRYMREVNPKFSRIAGWISSVGAAVSLNDLDGDGLPNDTCYVDTRSDQVILAPVPGTPPRFEPFELTPSPLPYDPTTTAPMGSLPGDFNEDGMMDILVYYWGRPPVAFLRRADKTAEAQSKLARSSYVACEVANAEERWYTNCATQADLDGDGHIDLIIGNYFPDGSRLLDSKADSPEQMNDSMSRALNGGRDRILLWSKSTTGAQPSAAFKDASYSLSDEVARGWTLAVGAADLDGDLLPEIYFAHDFGPDRLLHNLSRPGQLRFEILEGRKSFDTPASKVLGRDSFKGMGVDFADLNGDGLLDIYVSNIAGEYSLEESHFAWISTGQPDLMKQGIAPYVDRSEPLGLSRSGWGWDARWVDFDNDGTQEALQATGFMRGVVNRWPELHELAMGNDQLLRDPKNWPRFLPGDDLSGHARNPFFVRASNGRYYDIASDLGLSDSQVSRGIAVADVNGDGRLDFALANQWMPSFIYLNQTNNAGAFLGLHLLLPVGGEQVTGAKVSSGHPGPKLRGRPAIGAFVTAHLPDGRRLVAQVDGGTGHSGKRSPDAHFGLANLPQDKELQVDLAWRDANGNAHQQTLKLTPGWHTVLLGSQETQGGTTHGDE